MIQQLDVQALAQAKATATATATAATATVATSIGADGNAEATLAQAVLLDVREPWEFELARIEGSVNVPMSTLAGRVDEVRALQGNADGDSPKPIVLICHHGARSMNCAQFLAGQGLEGLLNLRGGIDAWSQRVDASVPRY